MRAARADRDELVAEACQEHRLTLRMPQQLVARTQAIGVDARAEIRAGELRLSSHERSPE